MDYKKAGKIRDILLVIGNIVIVIGFLWQPVLIILGVVIACVCLIPHFLYCRCPHCRKVLRINSGDYCPYCRKKLDGEAPETAEKN